MLANILIQGVYVALHVPQITADDVVIYLNHMAVMIGTKMLHYTNLGGMDV